MPEIDFRSSPNKRHSGRGWVLGPEGGWPNNRLESKTVVSMVEALLVLTKIGDERVRLGAFTINAILDRSHGRPAQAITGGPVTIVVETGISRE